MIVVDLGALHHRPGVSSTFYLADKYRPRILYAFDPHPEFQTGRERIGGSGTLVVRQRAAAWDSTGIVRIETDTTRTRVVEEGGVPTPSFRLATWLRSLPLKDGVIVKMDIEGAEYVVLPDMIALGVDALLERMLIEWHGDPLPLSCPVEEWTL